MGWQAGGENRLPAGRLASNALAHVRCSVAECVANGAGIAMSKLS